MTRTLRLRSFEEVAREIDALAQARAPRAHGAWSVGRVLAHCAQSIECSLAGYPRMRSTLFRATIGRIALGKFLRQGHMSHDLEAAIPGAPDIPDTSLADGISRLRSAMASFEAHRGDFRPHFAFGPVARDDYERVHAMHIANHLQAIDLDR